MRPASAGGAVAAAALLIVALTAQVSGPDADELVRTAAEAPHAVSYLGQVQATRWGTKTAVSTITRVEHKAPDAYRRTFLAPQSLYGETVITRGARTTDFSLRNSTVYVSENYAPENQIAFNDNIALLFANYKAVSGPDEAVAGREAMTVSLINRHSGERMLRLWIDARTKIVLAKESYHSDGSLATRVRFDEIRYTNDIPGGIFAVHVPAGYTVVHGRKYGQVSTDIGSAVRSAGFTPIGPRYLPQGFSIVSADVTMFQGIKNLHLLYSDGLRNISLFENAGNAVADFGALRPMTTSFEGHDAQYARDGPTTLLAWHEHALGFVLVGDLDVKELADIASSVVP